jgi:hypothetical protein
MEHTGVMHVEAHLLDRVGDVRPGEVEVLESSDQAVVGSRVADGGPPRHVRRDLGLSIDRRGVGLAVAHADAKDVPNVLALLVKEEAIGLLLH